MRRALVLAERYASLDCLSVEVTAAEEIRFRAQARDGDASCCLGDRRQYRTIERAGGGIWRRDFRVDVQDDLGVLPPVRILGGGIARIRAAAR
ncbi:hypothetical protein [Mesorhizobium sp. CA5]|uniref:hypothetical protein n=1 Tax=Mesorhizobium sp. CA5 TaxID=2876638 RepID=UPI001CD0D0A2|nr:hypothetical protein [Mesorhizobium sp. CA5]MBZ9841931.1 hypothetical protein [Mesorhizobium sp. CA5]